jgi:hypothetical protein
MTFKGGLGDILLAIYGNNVFGALDSIADGDMVQVVIVSHCRGVGELFERHPKRNQIEIVDLEFIEPFTHQHLLEYGDLPELDSYDRSNAKEIPTYTSREDLQFTKGLSEKVIVFALAASDTKRNVPKDVADAAANICVEAGYQVVTVGRTYEPWHRWGGTRWMGQRAEVALRDGYGIKNGVDALTMPGALNIIRKAKAVFCGLSAIQLAAWTYRRPAYVLTAKEFAPVIEMISQWRCAGRWYADGHAFVRYLDEWSPEHFRLFVEGLK